MSHIAVIADTRADEITMLAARQAMIPQSMVVPFADGEQILTEILDSRAGPGVSLTTAGVASAAVAQCAHRARLDLNECLGESPFAGDIKATLRAIMSAREVVYVANPNHITGAHFTVHELEAIARAVPRGLLLIDEHYHDCFGITGQSLLEKYPNIVIRRSFAVAQVTASSESGFLMAHPGTIRRLLALSGPQQFTVTKGKAVLAGLGNTETIAHRLQEIHDESLRLATGLSRLRVHSQLCPADFLLIKVGHAAGAGNHLASRRLAVENLDGYPQMKGYLRYWIQSPRTNDRLLRAFKSMPPEFLYPSRPDRRPIRLVRGASGPADDAFAGRLDEENWLSRLERCQVSQAESI